MCSVHQYVPEKCPPDIFPCCLTPKVKWLFEQVQTPFRLWALVSSYDTEQLEWSRIRDELVSVIKALGFHEELGSEIVKILGSHKAMRRMILPDAGIEEIERVLR